MAAGRGGGPNRRVGLLLDKSMEADEILSRSSQVEKIDTVARRTFGLDSPAAGNGALNLNVLTGGPAIVQINQKNG